MATRKPKQKAPKPRNKPPLDWKAIDAKRAAAFGKLESEVCDLANFGEIAFHLGDHGSPELYDVAVDHLVKMLRQFKDRYYATLEG